jgi:hypothetical protein
MSPADVYEQLVELIGRELELAGQARFDELSQVSAARAALIAQLPDVPPAAAGPALARAEVMHKRLTVELLRGREALLLELARVEHGLRAARGYAPPRRSSSMISASA